MTDRDFKLLVREYFQAKTLMKYPTKVIERPAFKERKKGLEKLILSELEAFTEREQQELPFKETEI